MITLAFPVSGKSFCSFLLGILLLLVVLFSTTVAMAQTQQQPFLFASTSVNGQEAVVTFLRDEISSVLTLLPAAPIPFAHQCLPEAVGSKLYIATPLAQISNRNCGGDCWSSGAVAEIAPGSPYTASTTGNSVYAVAEATGQYVYLIKITEPDVNGDSQFILDQFQIVRGAAPALIPINSQALPYLGQMGGIYPDANSHGIAIYTTVGEPIAAPPTQTPTLFLITFDSATGVANIPAVGTAFSGSYASTLAGSPRGDSIVVGSSNSSVLEPTSSGAVTVLYLSTTTFEITSATTVPVYGTWPSQVFFGPAGTLFYVQYVSPSQQGPAPFHIYASNTLQELSTSPIPFADWSTIFENIGDPNGNFVYATNSNSPATGVQVYFVDTGTGYPTQSGPLTSPFGQAYVLQPIFATMAGERPGACAETNLFRVRHLPPTGRGHPAGNPFDHRQQSRKPANHFTRGHKRGSANADSDRVVHGRHNADGFIIGVHWRNFRELRDHGTGDGHRRESHSKLGGKCKLQIPNAGGLVHANRDSHGDRGGIKQVVAAERHLADAGRELTGTRYTNLPTTDHS